ncbi:MAG TPA: DUF58 domain-containing protein, partial [Tepidisphaeraceae bacterium]|nr:DUF58 domain-containing protein [Tepidisphaeraceae bacterium]
MPLLDPDFVSRLDRLEILSRKILEGKLRGEHTARKHGPSAEFADHRNYTPGDDPRFIDWNILARLDRLLVKIFLAEQEPFLYLVLDQSKSCDFGQPNKAIYIKQVAAALGFVGLVNHHRVKILALGGGPIKQAGPLHSRFVLPRMIK